MLRICHLIPAAPRAGAEIRCHTIARCYAPGAENRLMAFSVADIAIRVMAFKLALHFIVSERNSAKI